MSVHACFAINVTTPNLSALGQHGPRAKSVRGRLPHTFLNVRFFRGAITASGTEATYLSSDSLPKSCR